MNAREQLAALRAEIEMAEVAAAYEEALEKYRDDMSPGTKAKYRELAVELDRLRTEVKQGVRRRTQVETRAEAAVPTEVMVASTQPTPAPSEKKRRWL